MTKTHDISVETGPYNPRRYGKPWIATVTLKGKRDLEMHWGEFVGDSSDGMLELDDIPVGTIVARGQKDYRGKNTYSGYYILEESGECRHLTDNRAELIRFFRNGFPEKPGPRIWWQVAVEPPEEASGCGYLGWTVSSFCAEFLVEKLDHGYVIKHFRGKEFDSEEKAREWAERYNGTVERFEKPGYSTL